MEQVLLELNIIGCCCLCSVLIVDIDLVELEVVVQEPVYALGDNCLNGYCYTGTLRFYALVSLTSKLATGFTRTYNTPHVPMQRYLHPIHNPLCNLATNVTA